MMRAPLATAQRIALASASTGIDRCGPTTFATSSSAGGCKPGDADAVVRPCRDQAGDERPVPLGVDGGGPADEALRRGDPAAQLGVRSVDPGVDHGDPDRRERRAAPSRRRTTCSAPRTTAAAEAGRSGRTRPPAPQPLDVPRACHAPQRRRRRSGDRERRNRGKVDDIGRPARAELLDDRGAIGGRGEPDGEPSRLRRWSARCEAERNGPDGDRCPRDHFGCPGGTVTVSAGPACPSAVSRYVAVLLGRTVTANEPSSRGATLTDGTHAAGAGQLLEQRRLDVAREAGDDDRLARRRSRAAAGRRGARRAGTPSSGGRARARTSAAFEEHPGAASS